MENFPSLYAILYAALLAAKRNANAALNQGNTRGLSVDDLLLLAAIHTHGCPTMRALAQRTDRDIASVSRQVSTLCQKGWIIKKAGNLDARERSVMLSDRANATLQEGLAQLDRVFDIMTSRLSLTEKKELYRMLSTLLEL